MPEDQIAALIQRSLPLWMRGDGWFGLLVILVVAGVGACLGAYLAQKGRNLASKEDLARITKIAEDVKAAVSGDLWARQERWRLRRDVYLRILEDLYEGLAIYNGLVSAFVDQLSLPEKHRTLAENTSRTGRVVDSIRRTFAVSGVLFSPDAQAALRAFETTMADVAGKTPDLTIEDLRTIASNFICTHEALVKAARDDLAVV